MKIEFEQSAAPKAAEDQDLVIEDIEDHLAPLETAALDGEWNCSCSSTSCSCTSTSCFYIF